MPQSSSDILEASQLNTNEILDIINDDVPEIIEDDKKGTKEPTREPEKKVDEKEEKKEEIELVGDEVDEEEQPSYDEDQIDIIAPARRKEILKKYPTLFKDFPHLEKAYFRDQQYNELFGTPEEAERLVQTANYFNEFSSNLMKGDTRSTLGAIKQENPEAFAKIVDNYLGALREVDDRAFFHVISNTIKSTVASMVQEANRTQNEDLLGAARLLHQFVTGTTEWQGMTSYGRPKAREEQQEESELQRERENFFYERFETTQSDLQNRVDGVLKNTIDQNMDPRGSMTPYVKRVAIDEVFKNTQKLIRADPQFVRLLDRLWERAAEERFSKSSVEKIRSAYLSKAKSLLPDQIKKSRIEALKGLGKRVREDTNGNNSNSRSRESTTSPELLRGSKGKDNPSKGKSTLAFLNED